MGFDSSLTTVSGIQQGPYCFFRDGVAEFDPNNITFWKKGNYTTPMGLSKVRDQGEGTPDWDSTIYNQIIVNETARFIDDHLESNRKNDPMFIYASLGAVHTPHSPPNAYFDGSPIAEEYPTPHMDMLYELDKVVGSLISIVEDKLDDTIIIFTSDNGGIRMTESQQYGHLSSGILRGHKGSIYEGGHRVPLIIRRDRIFPANEERTHFVGLNDIYSTLCDLAGVEVPEGSAIDSVSFTRYLRDKRNRQNLRKDIAFWTYKKRGSNKKYLSAGE